MVPQISVRHNSQRLGIWCKVSLPPHSSHFEFPILSHLFRLALVAKVLVDALIANCRIPLGRLYISEHHVIKRSWIFIKSKNLHWIKSVLIWVMPQVLKLIFDVLFDGLLDLHYTVSEFLHVHLISCFSLVSKATFTCVSAFSLELAWLIAWVSLYKWDWFYIKSFLGMNDGMCTWRGHTEPLFLSFHQSENPAFLG